MSGFFFCLSHVFISTKRSHKNNFKIMWFSCSWFWQVYWLFLFSTSALLELAKQTLPRDSTLGLAYLLAVPHVSQCRSLVIFSCLYKASHLFTKLCSVFVLFGLGLQILIHCSVRKCICFSDLNVLVWPCQVLNVSFFSVLSFKCFLLYCSIFPKLLILQVLSYLVDINIMYQ